MMILVSSIITVMLYLLLRIGELTASPTINLEKLAHLDKIKNFSIFNPSKEYFLPEIVTFHLFTRTVQCYELYPETNKTLKESGFNPNRPTKIVIHGYLGNYFKGIQVLALRYMLANEDVNLIIVDWGGFQDVDYFYAAKKTKYIGGRTASFIQLLVSFGAKMDDIHLIGHSLGAHISGFAGALLKGKIGRITGLDPAKPFFHRVPPEERLDVTDAKFIDCIHTCSGTLGLEEPICTADFYPNGGYNIQPGCHFYDFGRCSHIRAYEYFMESIEPTYRFPAFSCPSIPKYGWNNCKLETFDMGYYTPPRAQGIYFTVTNDRPPFSPIY